MSLQYISDVSGNTTGVYIPINEWNKLQEKFKGIENEELDIPEWHKHVLNERIVEYKKSPETTIDFDSAIEEIENTL